jgi:hypothetical protein
VLQRLSKAIWPLCRCKSDIFRDDRYDLYGPIWIMATLIVEITIVGFIDYNIDVWTMTEEIKEGLIAPVDYMSLYSL